MSHEVRKTLRQTQWCSQRTFPQETYSEACNVFRNHLACISNFELEETKAEKCEWFAKSHSHGAWPGQEARPMGSPHRFIHSFFTHSLFLSFSECTPGHFYVPGIVLDAERWTGQSPLRARTGEELLGTGYRPGKQKWNGGWSTGRNESARGKSWPVSMLLENFREE